MSGGGILIVQMLVREVIGAIFRKTDRQKPIKGYHASQTFSASGGAWLMIAVIVFLIGTIMWAWVSGKMEVKSWWAYALLIAIIAYLGFLLRYAIHMLKAKIHVGPDMLLLDGAVEVRPDTKIKKWFRRELIGFTPGQFKVEIPWCDIHQIDFINSDLVPAGMTVESKSHDRYFMDLSYFDVSLVAEIKKYCNKTKIIYY